MIDIIYLAFSVIVIIIAIILIKIHFIGNNDVSENRRCQHCTSLPRKDQAEAMAISDIASNIAKAIHMMEKFCEDEKMSDYYKRNIKVNMQEAREIYSKLIFTRDWIMFKKLIKDAQKDAKE